MDTFISHVKRFGAKIANKSLFFSFEGGKKAGFSYEAAFRKLFLTFFQRAPFTAARNKSAYWAAEKRIGLVPAEGSSFAMRPTRSA